MNLSKTSVDYKITIKSEPITDEDNERDEDLCHNPNFHILTPDIEKKTYQYLISDFDQFEKLKLEHLHIKSEAIEDETETLNKSFPHTENMCFGSSKDISNKNLTSFDIKSEHDPEENDLLFCAEIVDSSSSDVDATRNNSNPLSDNCDSSKLLEINKEPIDLSYAAIDVTYPDIKNECAEYSAKAEDVCNKVIRCPECSYTCSHASKLKYHAVKHSSEKPFTCGHCGRSFCRKDGLNKHIFTHSGQKPFKCLQCDRAFGRKDCLKKHMNTHLTKELLARSWCNITFNPKDDHQNHNIEHNRESHHLRFENNLSQYLKTQYPFSCQECNYSCNLKGNLKRHMLTHSSWKYNLDMHIRNNNGDKPFSCQECNFSCNQKGNLKRHMLTHFSWKGNLDKDVRNNNRDKPFSCQECNFSFNQKSNLNRHLLTHAEKTLTFLSKQLYFARARGSNLEPDIFKQKAFQKLTFSFPQSGILNTPNLTSVENKPFKCSECSFTCFSKSILGLHKLSLGAH